MTGQDTSSGRTGLRPTRSRRPVISRRESNIYSVKFDFGSEVAARLPRAKVSWSSRFLRSSTPHLFRQQGADQSLAAIRVGKQRGDVGSSLDRLVQALQSTGGANALPTGPLMSVLLRRPHVLGSMEATSIVTRGAL